MDLKVYSNAGCTKVQDISDRRMTEIAKVFLRMMADFYADPVHVEGFKRYKESLEKKN